MIIDQFSRYLECIPLPETTAETVAHRFITDYCCRYGFPQVIHSDQGANFQSELFTKMCEQLNIAKTRTTAWSPRSNGSIERQNKTVVAMIRSLGRDLKQWDEYLPHIASAIRAMPNRTTGYSPNQMMFGRQLRRPFHLVMDLPCPKTVNESEYLRNLNKIMKIAYDQARKNLSRHLQVQKRYHDVKLHQTQYEIGDYVYRIREGGKKGLSKKLMSLFQGPYMVEKSPVKPSILNL